jgi:ABC-type uncharacterized transport system permease subunit
MEMMAFIATVLDSAIRLSIPLLCACLAGLWSEKSGVVDIGLEGKMLIAAFASGAAAYATNSAWAGLIAGMAASVGFALVHGFAAISQRGNQIVSGVAINMLAAGLTVVVGNAWFGQGGRTPSLEGAARFADITLPFANELKPVPVLGPLYEEVISGHAAPVYLALLAVPLTWFVLGRTRFGLRLRAVGENPAAVDTAGISVTSLRYAGVIICGLLCGLRSLSRRLAVGKFSAAYDRRQGLHRAGSPDLCQLETAAGAGDLFSVRTARCRGHPYAGRAIALHRAGAGAGHSGAALCDDRVASRRFYRQGDAATRLWPALRQGTLNDDGAP